MDRVRGKRFDNEPKLNKRKVFATVIAIVVFIIVILSIKKIFKKDTKIAEMIVQTAYFTVYNNGKYGVIDNRGNTIVNTTYDEMIIIPNSARDIFICTYDVDYNTSIYKTKVLNSSGSEILKDYSNVQAIENSNANDIWFEDNILKYEKDGLYGLIDFNGNKVVDPIYNNIYALESTPKSIVVEKDGKKGIVNSTLGELVLQCIYNDVSSLSKDNADDGYIVNMNGKYGLVSATGKPILECNYQEIKHVTGNNMYAINDGTSLKVDSALNVIKDGGFQDIKSINGENIIIKQNELYGIINQSGEEKIAPKYEDLIFACDNYYIAKQNGLYGIISLDDTVCLDFKYISLNFLKTTNFYQGENADFTTDIINRNLETKLSNVIISDLNIDNGYMRIRQNNEYKYYNFNFEEKSNIDVLKSNTLFLTKQNGKYGYMNKNGELVVNCIYDDAKEQNEYGYCAVNKDGVWGVLSSDGTMVLEPSVNLDDSIYIEFIGKWHLYKDTDLKLYVK